VDSDGLNIGSGAAGHPAGQCFRPSATAILNSAALALKITSGQSGGTYQFRIYSTQGSYGSTCSALTLLASSGEFLASTVGTSFSMITQTFAGSNQIVLEANTAYAFGIVKTQDIPSPPATSMFAGYDSTGTHAGNRFTDISSPGAANDDTAFTVTGTTSSTPGQTTQCYGNCGTATNTNGTATTNFNASITLFYTAQSNLNGFVQNVSTRVAKTYTNGIILYLGLYTVERSCTNSGGQPFSAVCPGFLVKQGQFTNPQKGLVNMTMSQAVVSGQWIGIAVSASFNGLHLNDTNTAATMYQADGIIPGIISQYQTLGARNTYLRAYIGGFTPGAGGTPGGLGCSSVVCGLVALADSLGGGTFGGLLAFGIVFTIIIVPTLYVTRIHDEEGNIKGFMLPMEVLPIFAILLLVAFSAVGVLPVYIPVIIIVLLAWLFTDSMMGKRKDQGIS